MLGYHYIFKLFFFTNYINQKKASLWNCWFITHKPRITEKIKLKQICNNKDIEKNRSSN